MIKTDYTLWEFQEEAKVRMTERQQLLLALVMGAGKTITSIAAVEDLLDDGSLSKGALIIVPGSLKFQWQREILRFTERHALVIDGDPRRRALLYKHAHKFWYVILNYEAVVNDWQTVRKLPFDCIVLDEATYIKSFTAKRSKRVKTLGKMCDYRFGLTGQPIENRPEDLYSIMQFVDDSVLGPFDSFDRTFIVRDAYGKAISHRNLPLLRKRMAQAMVRKTRKDLKGLLPDVVEQVIPVRFSRAEARLYNIIKDDLLAKMDEVMGTFGANFDLDAHYGFGEQSGAAMKAQGEIATMMLALRQVCDDAELLKDSAVHYANRKLVLKNGEMVVGPGEGSAYAHGLMLAGHLNVLPKSSKRAALVELNEELFAQDEETKVVLFSFFKSGLNRLQADSARFANSVLYTGDMNARQKDTAKLKFQQDKRTRLFLSSDAGGYGVDLPMANYLVSFDLPWSTGKYEQRESRIIRLSTEFDHVTLIAMIVIGSLEERMHAALQEKKGVANAYLDGGYDSKGKFKMTLSSLSKFLRESAV